MTRKLIALVFLLAVFAALSACRRTETEATSETDIAAEATDHQLKVTFQGLIAFVENGDTFWALLPDANYDPANPKESDLPPNLLAELSHYDPAERETFLLHKFPPHFATITLKNAEAVEASSTVPQGGESIEGMILGLNFTTTASGLTAQLDKLATAKTIVDSLSSPTPPPAPTVEELQKLDKIHGTILPNLEAGVRDPRLAAAVKLQKVKVEAFPTVSDTNGKTKLFTFRPPVPHVQACPTTTGTFDLAELVVATASFSGNLEISRTGGTPITLRPIDLAKPIEILFSNESAPMARPHYGGFRWFYSLLDPAARPSASHHYIPCEPDPTFVGSKCPNLRMSL